MNKYNWNNKENFIEDFKNATSMSDFLVTHNMTASSGNFFTFKKWLKIHDLEINHFIKTISTAKITLKDRKISSPEAIFMENSQHYRKATKKRIKKENLIPYICAKCNNPGVWNGESLTLQLEHKNGVNYDNRLENLEYLCPNCHSQTMTYGGKNIHNKLFEIRINDLIKYKVIEEKTILDLIEKWGCNYNSVKMWIHKYAKKIEDYNVKIQINKNCTRYKEDVTQAIMNDIENSNFSLKSIKDIAIKYKLQTQGVRKLVKILNKELYEKLEIDITTKERSKASEIQNKRLNYLKNINKDNFNIEDMKKEFNMTLNGLMPWIFKHDPDLYKHIKTLIKKCCPQCQSTSMAKKGIMYKLIPLQKYKCKNCEKTFNYILE